MRPNKLSTLLVGAAAVGFCLAAGTVLAKSARKPVRGEQTDYRGPDRTKLHHIIEAVTRGTK